jgi:single-stranded DNA-binding protein
LKTSSTTLSPSFGTTSAAPFVTNIQRIEEHMSAIEAAFFGSLARDAECKVSKAGRNYLRCTVRVGDGDAVSWVNVTAFDEQAIEQADKFVKGARVYCEGSLKLDQWTSQDGAAKHGLSCMSWHCHLAAIGHNRPKANSKPQAASPPAGSNEMDDEIPF